MREGNRWSPCWIDRVVRSPRLRALLGFFVLVSLGVLGALAGQLNGGAEVAKANPVQTSEPKVELPGERTAKSDTFELPSGKRETVISEAPINYEVPSGQWKPIEEGFERDGKSFVNGNSGFEARLPANMGSGAVRVDFGDAWVAERLLGPASDAGELEGEATSYDAAVPGTNFEFATLPTGIDEKIVLQNASQPNLSRFELTMSAGVEPTLTKEGSIDFRASDGTLVGYLPAPVMYDSGEPIPVYSNAVEYGLEKRADGTWELTVEASREWLDESDRQWPVTIDPAVSEPIATTYDCTIFGKAGSQGTSGVCGNNGNPWLGALAWPETGELLRSLLYFSINPAFGGSSAIPSNAYLTNAEVQIYAPSNAPVAVSGAGIQLRNVESVGTNGWNTYASWLRAWFNPSNGTSANWLNPGGDYGFMSWEIPTASHGTAPGWWDFGGNIMTNYVQGWADGNIANWGLLLKQDDDTIGSCSPDPEACTKRSGYFASSAYEDTTKRPRMAVTWWPLAPTTSKLVSPTEGTVTARRLKLSSAWTSGVTGVKYQWREGKTGAFQEIPSTLIHDKNGKGVTGFQTLTEKEHGGSSPLYFDVAHASEALEKHGGTIQVRALFEGGAGSGYSAPVEAIVNRFTGAADDATAQVGPGSVDLLTGNFTVSHTDASIASFNSTLGFSRTLNSRGILPGPGSPNFNEETKALEEANKGVLGLGWKPGVGVEIASQSSWKNVVRESFTQEFEEGETYTFAYDTVYDTEGHPIPFEETEPNVFVAPPELTGWVLTVSGSNLVLADPSGTRTTFAPATGAPNEYVPVGVSALGGSGNQTREVYKYEGGKGILTEVIAPTAPGVTECTEGEGRTHGGCRVLQFTYEHASHWGAPESYGWRLASVGYVAPLQIASTVAEYNYNAKGQLIEEWDPRISPALKEKYTYTSEGQLQTITPAGQEPWTMQYKTFEAEQGGGRLVAVERASLVALAPVAKTTIAYGVSTTTPSGPYDLSPSTIEQWGQGELPVDATAVYPPDEVPASPPTSWAHATVYYMDAEGHDVNVATPKGAGTGSVSISTSETDQFGNVVRELTPQNRIRALASEHPKEEAEKLSTYRYYSADGTRLETEEGPEHLVRIQETGATKSARFYRSLAYVDPAPPAGLPPAHLPTKETTGARVGASILDARSTETAYNWNLRKPTEVAVAPGGEAAKITHVTVYDESSGLPIEERMPRYAEVGAKAATKTIYYTAAEMAAPNADCGGNTLLAGLPCKVEPTEQPGTSGQPQILVQHFLSYNGYASATEVVESPGGEAGNTRKMVLTYDAANRPTTQKTVGGGTSVPTREDLYSSTTGLPTKQQFKCEEACTGFDSQATTTTYNKIGQATEYEDADGNIAKATYDVDGRPVETSDGKGSDKMTYDPTSGLLTKVEDSGVGTLTASYDADGNLVERGLPNGITAKETFNQVDEPTGLSYIKSSSCGSSCTWLEESVERSVFGQIVNNTGSLVHDEYTYDNSGRLVKSAETPTGGGCTTREYKYDQDSNRRSQATVEATVGSSCSYTGGTTQKYEYDGADRLLGTGLTYDAFGRITKLPAVYAGGKELETSYFSTNMVASQTQNGVTNTFELDGSGRQRQRVQAGGVAGTEIFHYDGATDSPSWTALGSNWTRNIAGIGGELAAVQESSGTVIFDLTDLHGDVVATASSSPTATKLLATYRFDEFGEPESGRAGRFGWLGGKQRRTELASGVIQMGARSYIPALGRFLTPDAVRGGSANSYDYADQDPINAFDLDGNKLCIGVGHGHEVCGNKAQELRKAAHQANKTGKITVTFGSKQGAQRFLHSILQQGQWLENLRLKREEVTASQMYKLELKAEQIAREEASVSSSGFSTCGAISTATGSWGAALSIPGLAGAPETGGATAVPAAVSGVVSWFTGVLSGAGAC